VAGPVDDGRRNEVEVTGGRLAGRAERGVAVFRGIPYAATTAGEGRFAPPRPVEGWAGVRDALDFAPACPQPPIRENLLIRPEVERAMFRLSDEPTSEDCLFLNVWTPGADDGRRPVLVSYHGGAFKSCSGNARSAPWFDGTRLAQRADVVLVTVNHRIGVLGFLTGNAGMLDLNAALRWVRDNIARFGGDPDRVTIFGESGGGSKVTVQMAMPGAAGLFQRAASQSGVPIPATRDEAAAVRDAVIEELGTDAIQDVPIERLVDAGLAVSTRGCQFRPVVDGDTLPLAPAEAFAAGAAAAVPLVIGWTRDEATVFLREPRDLAWDDLPLSREVVEAYRERLPDADPWTLLMTYRTDVQFRLPALAIAEAKTGAPAYVFEFAWETPVLGGALGAGHGADVAFPLDNTDLHPATEGSASARALAPKISGAWVALARDGDPNHDGLPEWPPYAPDGAVMVLGDESRVEFRGRAGSPAPGPAARA
jgi:para-nitrobenzyl esterase